MPQFIVTTHETIIRQYRVEADTEDDAREEIEFCDGEEERSKYADPTSQPDTNWSVEDVTRAIDNEMYALCKHCDHFVDENAAADDYPGEVFDPLNPPLVGTDSSDWVAKYIHLEDGEQEFDHNAEPGEVHSGEEWEQLRPDLFKIHPDEKIGPNSRFHPRRGKIDSDSV